MEFEWFGVCPTACLVNLPLRHKLKYCPDTVARHEENGPRLSVQFSVWWCEQTCTYIQTCCVPGRERCSMHVSCVRGLFVQKVAFKPWSTVVMDVSGPLPSTPPACVQVLCYPSPLSFFCSAHDNIELWFAAKKIACSGFFFSFSSKVLDLWPVLVSCPICHHWLAFIGSRAKCLFSQYCWEGEMGGTLVYLWVGPLGCVRSRNCPLHTMDWQARQQPRHHSSRTLDFSRSFSFFKHNTHKS